jgi:hypothetical protein
VERGGLVEGNAVSIDVDAHHRQLGGGDVHDLIAGESMGFDSDGDFHAGSTRSDRPRVKAQSITYVYRLLENHGLK